MADLTLRIDGDSSAAKKALEDLGISFKEVDKAGEAMAKKAEEQWKNIKLAAAAAAAAVAAFAVSSVKAFMDAERVQKQLTRAAGEYADALSERAEAMSKVYAVDDDVIRQSQTLLTQWGGVGAATEETTKAILNYAAATGQDAVSATQDLIRNVESGGAGLAKMGVHFKETGDRGKDLASAVSALNKKFGGAAQADASTLEGSLKLAGMAFEDLQKAIGKTLGELIRASGVVPKATAWFRELTETIFTPKLQKQGETQEYIRAQVKIWEDILAGNTKGYKDYEKGIEFTFEEAQAKWAEWRAKLESEQKNAILSGSGLPGVTGRTNKGGKDDEAAQAAARAEAEKAKAISEKVAEQTRADMKRDEELDDKARAERQAAFAKELQAEAANVADRLKLLDDAAKARTAIRLDEEKKAAEIAERQAQNEKRIEEQAAKDREAAMQKRAAQAKQIADEIGAAFVNAMSSQLQKLAEGGEFDAAAFIGDILSAVAGIAGTVIGTYFGAPAVGAALGNLAGMGIKAGFTSLSASGKKRRTYHSGGWVGDEAELPRYHSGTWVGGDERPAILQTGERVLSRAEVARMGGQGGVDAAARGRGAGVTINVTALDSKSAARAFETDVGRGLALARRSGRGDVARMLGFEGVPR